MDSETIANGAFVVGFFLFTYRQCVAYQSNGTSKTDRSKTYLTLVFWHSVLVTASTPYIRLAYKRWYGHTPLNWMYSTFRSVLQPGHVSAIERRYPTTFPYPPSNELPGLDLSFFLHSFFGIGWVIAGHVTLVYSSKWSPKNHRRFAYGAFVVYAGHVSVAIYTLILNVAKHHPLCRMILVLNHVQGARLFLAAINAIKAGDLKTHQSLMLRNYLYTTEGSGTIRQAENFLWMMGGGPGLCQLKYNSAATNCIGSYIFRLLFTRTITIFHCFCVATLRRDREMIKNLRFEFRAFGVLVSILYGSWYFLGLDFIGKFMENGGYLVMIFIEAFFPKPGVDKGALWRMLTQEKVV